MESTVFSKPLNWQYHPLSNQFSLPGATPAGGPVFFPHIEGLNLYPEFEWTRIRHDLEQVIATGVPQGADYLLLASGGGATHLFPVYDTTGALQSVMGVVSVAAPVPAVPLPGLYDIFEKVVQAIPIDLVVFDVAQRFRYIGEQTVKDPQVRSLMIGKTEEAYCRYRNFPDDIARNRSRYFTECLQQKKVVHYEEVLPCDGRDLYKIRSFQPVLNAKGDVQFVVGFGFDISDVRQSESIIQRQHLAIESATDGIGLLDKEGRYYYLNKAHCTLFGYNDASELLGKSWRAIYPAKEIGRIEQQLFPLLMTQGSWTGQTTGLTKDGRTVIQEINLTLLPDGDLLCICRDVSQALRQAEELKKLALVVENTSSGVIITNEKQEIEWVNKGFTHITGYTLAEVQGMKPGIFQGPSTDKKALDYIGNQVSRGEMFASELLNYTKEGVPYWIHIKGQPLRDDTGKVVKFFAIQEDITVRKRMEEDLIVAKEAAEASARAKRRFLANMSHEIRTPMNAVIGLTAQLLKTGLSNTQLYYAETIQTAANNLLTIINDILDISRIEEGKLQIENIEMDLHEVLGRMRDVLAHKAEEKGIRFLLDMADNLPRHIMGDPYRLNQVLLNIVGNALKFTEQGFVNVSCGVQPTAPGSQEILIKVADTGIGMDTDILSSVFEEFSQGDQSFVRKFGGTGLGLSISRSLVELMEGCLDITSAPGKGTEVSIRLPFTHVCGAADLGETEQEPDLSVLHNCSVLLVEDNKFNSLVATLMLRNAGLKVTLAENGEEAVHQVAGNSFDLVLMDIQMPVMDGVSATKAIREELLNNTPIIALTAHALREEKEVYLASGMNDFLTKPFQEADLLKVLHRWVRKNTEQYV